MRPKTGPMIECAAKANFDFIARANDWELGEWEELPPESQAFHRSQVLAVLSALDAEASPKTWPVRIRLALLLPFPCRWNGWVRDVTARLERPKAGFGTWIG